MGIGIHPLRVAPFCALAQNGNFLSRLRRNVFPPSILVIMTVIPPRQYHAAGECFLKPGEALLDLLPLPVIPCFLIYKFPFLTVFDLYDVQKIIGVPNHVLAERAAVFGLFTDHFPRLFYTAKGHDLLKLRCQQIHTKRPQNRRGAAQGNCLMEHGIGRRLVFFKGVIFPAVAGAGKAAGKNIAGISISVLCRRQQRVRRRSCLVVITTIVEILYGLIHHIAKILTHVSVCPFCLLFLSGR